MHFFNIKKSFKLLILESKKIYSGITCHKLESQGKKNWVGVSIPPLPPARFGVMMETLILT